MDELNDRMNPESPHWAIFLGPSDAVGRTHDITDGIENGDIEATAHIGRGGVGVGVDVGSGNGRGKDKDKDQDQDRNQDK